MTLILHIYCFYIIFFKHYNLGLKFLVVADPKQLNVDLLLRRIYELYSDFALKNPFYSLEMPIRCDLFDSNLQAVLEQIEKSGVGTV